MIFCVDTDMQTFGRLGGTYIMRGADRFRPAVKPQAGTAGTGVRLPAAPHMRKTQISRQQAEPFGEWYDRWRAATRCTYPGCWKPLYDLDGCEQHTVERDIFWYSDMEPIPTVPPVAEEQESL